MAVHMHTNFVCEVTTVTHKFHVSEDTIQNECKIEEKELYVATEIN